MNTTNKEFLMSIQEIYDKILSASIFRLKDENWLTSVISLAGLQNEGNRRHPTNNEVHVYGDDVKYMNTIENTGMWQVPRQLAQYLINIGSFKIKTFLDIGTCRGCTITIIAIYLLRFGLTHIDTIDVYNFVDSSLKDMWKKLNLPINYILIPNDSSYLTYTTKPQYDIVFIDGNHEYNYVLNDFNQARTITNRICFHDINDCYCVDVVRIWNEIKNKEIIPNYKNIYEFTYHSHGYKLMGIGLVLL
jgi:hypothetical protein